MPACFALKRFADPIITLRGMLPMRTPWKHSLDRNSTEPASPFRFLSGRSFQERLQKLLDPAGICLNGRRCYDPSIHDERVYARILLQTSLGAGESYMAGWWDCDKLDVMFTRLFQAHPHSSIVPNRAHHLLETAVTRSQNFHTPSRAFEVGHRHYDLGNDLYQHMLDRRLIYSCAYWNNANSLDAAQEAKLDLICRKLDLQAGMRLLDIGCGWGGMARYAAEHYQVEVVGITVSQQQAALARSANRDLPVEIRLQDYRELNERFDRIVSVGMFEHVGVNNYRTYMQVVRHCLAPDGLFLLQTIGTNDPAGSRDPWTLRYIFPNSMLPSLHHIVAASTQILLIEDWHNFGADYDRTLMQWYANFEAAWDELKARYDERFHRMWRYYLLTSAASFRARRNQLWQIVFSRDGIPGGYRAPR